MAGLADIFSNGEDQNAINTAQQQLAQLNALPTPTAAQLTLPQLQQYVSAGILTPQQAQTYLQDTNALQGVTASNAGLTAEQQALGQLQAIAQAGGNDPEAQAAIQNVINQLTTTEAGQNSAAQQQLAAQGINNSGFKLAGLLAGNQNQATNANANALAAAAAGQQRQLGAIQGAGQLGSQVQGQQYQAAANTANAQNAINQFNATQQQQNAQFNTTQTAATQAANLANAQNIANQNTQTKQMQQESIPAAQQQAYQDALQKASSGIQGAENVAQQQSQVGQQNAGILGGLLNTAGTVGTAYLTGNPYTALATILANQNNAPNTNNQGYLNNASNVGAETLGTVGAAPMSTQGAGAASGGVITPDGTLNRPMNMSSGGMLDMKRGGSVPGTPIVPGDSPINDKVKAMLSPGEIVLPRSVTQPTPQPNRVLDFLRSLPQQKKTAIHPRAVADTLRGLTEHYQGGTI